MVAPISCVECRRRKIRCSKETPCQNCVKRSIVCNYPKQFRSIDVKKIRKQMINNDSSLDNSEERIRELEKRLLLSEDLLSTFDTNGISHLNVDESKYSYFGDKSFGSLSSTMLSEIIKDDRASAKSIYREINHEIKRLPQLSDNNVENVKLIKYFVNEYFERNEYTYLTGIFSREEIFEFIDGYNEIIEWNHDEQMMILLVMLIDVLKNCLNFKFEKPLLSNQVMKLKELLTYYFQISKVQPVETTNLIKTQIILINYYYYCYDFNKAWKVLFQLISNCYAIGLHIEQGPVWLKVNLFEAILCAVSSRPSVLDSSLTRRDLFRNDPTGEVEFIELLRLKNKINVDCHVNKTSVSFTQILKLDMKFDVYSTFLKTQLAKTDKNLDRSLYEKLNFLLLMTISFHLNLHFVTFETHVESDRKMMRLFNQLMDIVTSFVRPNELNIMRDKFAASECLLYQSLLIFIKYLNFKIVNSILNNNEQGKSDFNELRIIQKKLHKVRNENPDYGNFRAVKALETIQSLNIDELNDLSLIKDQSHQNNSSTGTETVSPSDLTPVQQDTLSTQLYSNNEFKDLLETIDVDLMARNIAAIAPFNIEEHILWKQ